MTPGRVASSSPGRPLSRAAFFVAVLILHVLPGCASRRVALPSDPGTALPDAVRVYEQVSSACREVRTLTGELVLSGRAGSQPLRGTLHAGFKRPASMRLELVSGFGEPFFTLVSAAGHATLLIPREKRVVKDAPPEEILAALTGAKLAPDDLLAILTGCVVPEPHATGGRLHRNGWASIELGGAATVYLQRAGSAWRVRAATRGEWRIEYPEWPEGAAFPTRVRLLSSSPIEMDFKARISQIETNVDLPDSAFTVTVRDEVPLTLEELTNGGPLREQ